MVDLIKAIIVGAAMGTGAAIPYMIRAKLMYDAQDIKILPLSFFVQLSLMFEVSPIVLAGFLGSIVYDSLSKK